MGCENTPCASHRLVRCFLQIKVHRLGGAGPRHQLFDQAFGIRSFHFGETLEKFATAVTNKLMVETELNLSLGMSSRRTYSLQRWYNGRWYNGRWYNGRWYNGRWYNGRWEVGLKNWLQVGLAGDGMWTLKNGGRLESGAKIPHAALTD